MVFGQILNPADHNPRRITKADKDFAKKRDFKTKFPVKIRDIHKIGKKISISTSVFGNENKEKYPIYVSKQCCEEKHVDFLCSYHLHQGRKHFCCYFLHGFITEEILKRHIKDCFKINAKQTIKMPKKDEFFKLKNF